MSYANVGMRHPVWAPLTSHTEGNEPVYGTGMVVEEGINATLTFNVDTNAVMWGDDRIVDMDDGITGYTVSFNPTGLRNAARAAILGEETGESGEYEITDAGSPWGGFGYFAVMRDEDRKKYYEAFWCRKVKFREPSMEARTKEGTITWRTPTLEGTGAGLDVDGGEHLKYIKHKTFETPAAAKAWLDALANIQAAGA